MELDAPGRSADRASRIICGLHAALTNCVVGKGYGKFRPLVEKYALLHNLPYKDRRDFGLNDFFVKTAFGLEKEDRQASNDSPPKEWMEAMRPENQ